MRKILEQVAAWLAMASLAVAQMGMPGFSGGGPIGQFDNDVPYSTVAGTSSATNGCVQKTGSTMTGNLVMSGGNIALGTNWLSGDGGAEGVFVAADGNVGIGRNTADTILHGRATNDTAYFLIDGYNNGAGIITYRYNGTLTAPTAVINNNPLGLFAMRGYNGTTNTATAAYVGGWSDDAWNTNSNGSELRFGTTATNSKTVLLRMVIDNNGNVGIGTNIPRATAHISGSVLVEGVQTNAGTLDVQGVTTVTNTYHVPGSWDVFPLVSTVTGQSTGTNVFIKYVFEPNVPGGGSSNGFISVICTNEPNWHSPTNKFTNTYWLAVN